MTTSGCKSLSSSSSKYLTLTASINEQNNKRTSEGGPGIWRITGFSRLKKYELEKAIRGANTKETNTDNEACDRCLRE